MTGWKQLSKGDKIAALQPLFARGLSYREVAAIMGTSSGAVAGFVFTNPTAKPPPAVSAEQIAGCMTFGDGIAAARIVVRLKAMKTPPPVERDGDRDTQSAPNRGGSAVDEAYPEAGPQAEASPAGTSIRMLAGRGAHSRKGEASRAEAAAESSGTASPEPVAQQRTSVEVVESSATGSTVRNVTAVSLPLVPSLARRSIPAATPPIDTAGHGKVVHLPMLDERPAEPAVSPETSLTQALVARIKADFERLMTSHPDGPTVRELSDLYGEPDGRVRDAVSRLRIARIATLLKRPITGRLHMVRFGERP